MRLTTLCYTENNGRWLMMHRVKKSEDENAGKWIGLGGHLQDGESPEECVRREVREEAGLELSDLRLRGIITFILPDWGNGQPAALGRRPDLPSPASLAAGCFLSEAGIRAGRKASEQLVGIAEESYAF